MISFRSRNLAIRQADRITRGVKSIYPHVSESKKQVFINHKLKEKFDDLKLRYKLCDIKLRNGLQIENLRSTAGTGADYYRNVIQWFKNKKRLNCHEESILAQIIGKINGIKNIYTARIFINKNSSCPEQRLGHIVAVITDIVFEKDKKYKFKNNEAIILDPWLGITEYAGEYFSKLRNEFGHIFPHLISNEKPIPKDITSTKSIKEYNKIRKENFKSDFSLKLVDENLDSEEYVLELKKEHPELILDNFKIIK